MKTVGNSIVRFFNICYEIDKNQSIRRTYPFVDNLKSHNSWSEVCVKIFECITTAFNYEITGCVPAADIYSHVVTVGRLSVIHHRAYFAFISLRIIWPIVVSLKMELCSCVC